MSKVVHHAHHKIADKPKQENRKKGRDAALLILVAAFLTGAAVGCILAGKLAPSNLGNLLQQALSSQTRPALWRELWAVFRWPIFFVIGYLGLLRAAAQTPGRAQLLLGSAVCCGPLALCIFLDRTVVLNLLDILLASLVSA